MYFLNQSSGKKANINQLKNFSKVEIKFKLIFQ